MYMMHTPARTDELRLSEVTSALSYALDLVEGQPAGHAVRTCLVGLRLATELGLSPTQRSALFHAQPLRGVTPPRRAWHGPPADGGSL
jgi:hypothetical protein